MAKDRKQSVKRNELGLRQRGELDRLKEGIGRRRTASSLNPLTLKPGAGHIRGSSYSSCLGLGLPIYSPSPLRSLL